MDRAGHILVDDALVEILTTEMGVTSSRKNLKDALVDGQERHIKSTTAKVVHNDLALAIRLVKTVGDGSRSGLVDDTQNVQASNNAGILSSLALVVVEVGRLSKTVSSCS